jgi:hypothetical protein
MAVYVDDAFVAGDWGRWTGGGHMQADSVEELHAFAARIGLRRSWFQTRPGRPEHDHYDLTRGKRAQAIAAGAVAETWRDAARRHHDARRADA